MMAHDAFQGIVRAVVTVRSRHLDVQQGRRAEGIEVFRPTGLAEASEIVVAVGTIAFALAYLRYGQGVELLVGKEVAVMALGASCAAFTDLRVEQQRATFGYSSIAPSSPWT